MNKPVKKIRGENRMEKAIDVRDLPEEEVKLIRDFVGFLRQKAMAKEKTEEERKQEIAFAAWPLGVKGKLNRKEIYDNL